MKNIDFNPLSFFNMPSAGAVNPFKEPLEFKPESVQVAQSYKPTISDKVNILRDIECDWHENNPTHAGFYTGFAINALDAAADLTTGVGKAIVGSKSKSVGSVLSTIAAIKSKIPQINSNPKLKQFFDSLAKWASENNITRDLFRFEWDQGATKSSGVWHLKFVLDIWKRIPKERRDKLINALSVVFKNSNSVNSVTNLATINALQKMLDSKTVGDERTIKAEFRLSINPNVVIGNEKGLEARTGLHFSANIPLKRHLTYEA